MAKDIITEEEWDFEEEKRPAPPAKPKRSSHSGGGTKDYLIVALIAIIAVMGINNFIYARSGDPGFVGGALGGGGSCCGAGGGGAAGGGAPSNAAELEQLGLDYYVEQTGDQDLESITADVQEFGCHQEIYLFKDGQQVMRIGHSRGQLYLM